MHVILDLLRATVAKDRLQACEATLSATRSILRHLFSCHIRISRRVASSKTWLTAVVAMSGRLAAIAVLRTAITEGGAGASEARIATAASGFADTRTAHSSINERQGNKYCEENGPHYDYL